MLSYEFESLNDRQKKQIENKYSYISEELINAEIPVLVSDKWVEPLQQMFDSLSEEEQSHISMSERLSISFYTEFEGQSRQPRFTTTDGTESGLSILAM